ncbi:kh domain containing rna binding protein [Holotrichia oblita]|uniref:Kh domain containing rna binding protein n=1 Tax=Holotrichia oblita TaxID=644536 RepID=A0ACB9TL06_HOLOL|nr:kh domain containing rna binding protein [Holotrichia oblita]
MKREADGDMGAPQKKTRRGDEELRLLIPSKVAGSIIGKGGQNITKLRSQYKASITVPDCPGPERMLTLSSDLESICSIVNDVVPNLEERHSVLSYPPIFIFLLYFPERLENKWRRIRPENDDTPEPSGMRHRQRRKQDQGDQRSNINFIIIAFLQKTGARIKIFSNWAPQSTDRIIQIVGEPAKCIDTIREVITLIKTNPIKGPVSPYDPHNYDDYYAEEYGGYGNSGSDRRGGGQRGGNGPRDRDGGGRFQSNNRGPPSSQRGPMGGG